METENSLASLTISAAAAAAAPTRLDMGTMVGAPVAAAAAAATNESPEEEELQAQRIASDSAFDSFVVDEHEQNGKWEGHSMFAPFTSGWQQTETEPLIVAKGEGVYVWDHRGKKYLDALAGLWCVSLGFNEQRLVNAVNRQLTTLPFYHSFWNRTSQPPLDLAKALIELFTPVKLGKVFFCNIGSEANDTQVKLVWYYNNALGRTQKKNFISRLKSYHGLTLIATNEIEEEYSTRLAENLEKLILKEGPETIAAFIGEPLMGAGGVIPPPATYWDTAHLGMGLHMGAIQSLALCLWKHYESTSMPSFLKRISGLWVPAVGAYLRAQCQAIGMLVRIAGDIIMISPPLISTAAELQQIVKFAEAALKATERYIVQLQMSKQ
ncbi:unnamed protein product [Sphagnum jensenii]|uniref:Uncharacterized protein n=1 Tax=Sphagnum jensenii TaxID=128206 RepID=A0ABP1AQN7_9BRYO